MHHVQVVGGLLQQQTRGVLAGRVPVLEVVVAAVADEVTAPDRLHLADGAAADQVAHRTHHVHVPHVVTHVELRAGLVGGAQDLDGVVHAGRQGFLDVDGNPGPEQLAGHLRVGVVGGGDQGRIDALGDQLRDVACQFDIAATETLWETCFRIWVWISGGGDAAVEPWELEMFGDVGPGSHPDHADT